MRHRVDERLQRLLAVLAHLADRGPVRLDDLAERLRVSRSQLEKDLFLAQFVGLPPYDLPGTTPDIVIEGDTVAATVPEHFRHQPNLSRGEAFAVLTCGRAALELDGSLGALASALGKVEAALQIDGTVQLELDEPPLLGVFRDAQRDRQRLAVVYWSAWRDALTERELDPVHVFYADGEWYATCFDHSSGERRKFRIDRVQRVEPTGVLFEADDAETVAEPYEPPADAVAVTVCFPAAARWVTEYEDVQVTDSDDDGFTGELTVAGTLWLERLLLRTGGVVVTPEELRDMGALAARRVLAHYT